MITASELREKQRKYIQETEDAEFKLIASRLEDAYKKAGNFIQIAKISDTNVEKLRQLGYFVEYKVAPSYRYDESYYTISW